MGIESTRRKIAAFTLVEMLVSVSVIAILASLLLVAVAKSKSRARDTHCLSNLRQLGVHMASYVAAHDHYPEANPLTTSAWLGFGGEADPRLMDCPNIGGGNYRPNYFGSVGPGRQPHLGLALDLSTLKPRPSGDIRAPSEMIAIVDFVFWLLPPKLQRGGPAEPRFHRGGIQFLLVDGHVERMGTNKFSEPSTRHRWNADNEPHHDS